MDLPRVRKVDAYCWFSSWVTTASRSIFDIWHMMIYVNIYINICVFTYAYICLCIVCMRKGPWTSLLPVCLRPTINTVWRTWPFAVSRLVGFNMWTIDAASSNKNKAKQTLRSDKRINILFILTHAYVQWFCFFQKRFMNVHLQISYYPSYYGGWEGASPACLGESNAMVHWVATTLCCDDLFRTL